MATETAPPQSPDGGKTKPGEKPSEKPTPEGRRAAVDAAAGTEPTLEVPQPEPPALSGAQRANATEWFMSSDEEEVGWAVLPINVAPAGQKERVIDFKIQVVDRERIRELRRESERMNAAGVSEIDEMEANLKVAVEGLLEPDIKGDERLREVRGQQFLDPADALVARFAHKPGIIDQIAGKVTQISGYNDADVKEVRAAGN